MLTKLTIKVPEYNKNKKDNSTTSLASFWCPYY